MEYRTLLWVAGASLAIGFSAGISAATSNNLLVLEATNTPFGSYVLHYNPAQHIQDFPALNQSEQDFHFLA